MNAIYTELADVAVEMIADFGRPLQIIPAPVASVEPDADSWDDEPGDTEAETAAPIDVIGVQDTFDAREVDGDLILATDVRYLLDAAVEPPSAGRIKDGETHYAIVRVIAERPGPVVMYYEVHAR